MGKPLNEISGRVFGRVTVLRRAGSWKGKATWHCLCQCGKEWVVIGSDLVKGHTKSCGCATGEIISAARCIDDVPRKGTKLYDAWLNMKARCLNPNNTMAYRYHARGITIYPDWIASFEAFRDVVGEPPGPEFTLERINNDGNYEPGNVTWATRKQQAVNKTHGGTAARKGERNIKAKLTEADIRHIRGSSLSGAKLADLYSVSRANISTIRQRKSWKHIE